MGESKKESGCIEDNRSFETMTSAELRNKSIDALVKKFTELALRQYEANLDDDIAKYTRLFRQMVSVTEELKSRSGDQRNALLPLYNHPNPQVRLKAAKNTLALAPLRARQVLEEIAAPKDDPEALEAGMSLVNLDSGVFKPK